ncbi:MAG: phospholipase D-like domain-containing protein [Rhizomicrobium sp.]
MFPIWIAWPSPAARLLATLVYVLLAGLVTADVLLKKRDVRGALGWIAAAWLSPVAGALLYYIFGINRVTRRASRLGKLDGRDKSDGASDPALQTSDHIRILAEVGRRVTGRPLIGGNRISILEGGEEAYPAMLKAIGGAQHSLAMASYIFRNDAAGRAFAEALISAADRGVETRVLLDSVGTGYLFSGIFNRLRSRGVPAARFLHTWMPWRMPFLNMRNHRKLLVVDGRVAFIGGMNIGREYSRSLSKGNYIDDIHFLIEGPAAGAAMDAFARDWTFTTEEALDQPCWWPELGPSGPVPARGLSSGPDADLYKLETLLGAALSLARKRVRIVTPYFLPDQRLEFAIAEAAIRGVGVDIVIPEHCDYVFLDWAVLAHLRFLRRVELNIYMSPLPFDHSKLATVDGEWSLIGSSNWDARSFRLNFEYDLECYDAQFATALDIIIDEKIARARKVNYDELMSRPLALRLRDAAARLLTPYL